MGGGGVGLCLDSKHLVLVTVDPVDSNFVFVGGGWGWGWGSVITEQPPPRPGISRSC